MNGDAFESFTFVTAAKFSLFREGDFFAFAGFNGEEAKALGLSGIDSDLISIFELPLFKKRGGDLEMLFGKFIFGDAKRERLERRSSLEWKEE